MQSNWITNTNKQKTDYNNGKCPFKNSYSAMFIIAM